MDMNMNADVQEHRSYGFGIGLLAGAFAGAGLMMWLAPRMGSELRQRATETARRVRERATEKYQEVSNHVSETVDELARKGQDVRDDVAGAVAHGAREVERFATAVKTDGIAEDRKHSAGDRSPSKPRSL
jgi:gas vesicle protein